MPKEIANIEGVLIIADKHNVPEVMIRKDADNGGPPVFFMVQPMGFEDIQKYLNELVRHAVACAQAGEK
jgi:hypothetical protein